jgi:DNA replication protein DnaC
MPEPLSGLDVEVRKDTFECKRCRIAFVQPILYAMEPNPDDPEGAPVARAWGGDAAFPTHCKVCVADIREEEARREEAALRAVRMDPENPEYRQRLKTAGISHPKLLYATLKNFDRTGNPEAYNAARSFVEGVLAGELGDRPWRFFTGPTGTGKTHLLVGMDRALYAMGYKGKAVVVVAPLFSELVRAGYSDYSASALLAAVRDADVAFIDDLGRGRQTDDKASMMNELGCLREGKPTGWSSNFTREGLVKRNAEFMTLASRLGPSSCWTVELLDRDRRDDAPRTKD